MLRLLAGEVEKLVPLTSEKIKFFVNDLFSKCDQIRPKLRIWPQLLKKYLMENIIFCAAPFGTLARQTEQLARWHAKLNNWHTFGTWARGHVDHRQ